MATWLSTLSIPMVDVTIWEIYVTDIVCVIWESNRWLNTFFGYIDWKRENKNFTSVVRHEDSQSCNLTGITSYFATIFEKQCTSNCLPHVNYSCPMDLCDLFALLMFTEDEVHSKPGGLLSYIIRACAAALLTWLTNVFNKLLLMGCFPLMWKSTFIVALHRKDWL